MSRILTGFAVILVAAVWMAGSWFFFDSIAVGDQGPGAPAVADANNAGPKDQNKGEESCPRWKGHRGFLKNLDLSDVQKKQVKTITSEERPKMKPLVQQLKAGREQLGALRKGGPFDETKVRSIAKGQADTLTELIVVRERMRSRVYALLTPEQRAKSDELRESWKAQHQKGPKQEN